MTSQAFLYDAIRTPRGKGKPTGALYEVKPIQLITGLLHELRTRHPDLDPATVDDVVLGVVTPIGDQGMDIARTAVLAAGYPETTGGVQLNRFCASGLEAVNQAAQRVRSGRSEEHTSELQSHHDLVCRLLLEKKKTKKIHHTSSNKKKTYNKTK